MMRPFSLTVFVALVQLIPFSVALPAGESSIVARSQLYPNAPAVKAEAFVDRRDLLLESRSPRRGDPELVTVWVPNTHTRLVVTIGIQLAGNTVSQLLLNAVGNCLNHILQVGDGNLDHGAYYQVGANAVSLQVWNANNHQTTYSVLAGVLGALHEWMRSHQFTSASFGIYDGANQVGNGVINGAG